MSEERITAGGRPARLLAILAVAAALRLWNLDAASLWYDEVVTMRVARGEGAAAIIERLDRIDGTRAPLHPLVLHAWLRLFGPSDLAGRAFSALCGLATVAVVYVVGRIAYDDRTGLWSAWLAAVCPPLVYYSQEARMYAWLVLVTALSWLVLLSFRQAAGTGRCVVYGLLLIALAYSHPLGLFMIAAHGLAYLLARPAVRLSFFRWLMIQAGVALAIAPWLRPISTMGRTTRCHAIRSGTCWRSRSSTSAATAWCCSSAWRSSPRGSLFPSRSVNAVASASTIPPRA